MVVTFLGQGFTPNIDGAVGTNLMKYFSSNDFTSFTGLSAFASTAGVNLLASCIQSGNDFENLNLIVGIDQDGTSKEALEEILKLEINSYFFYQTEKVIFHPKIYLFEGEEKTVIVLGSSNLTGAGLYKNVESSILIEFDNDDTDGIALLEEIKTYYSTIFDYSDPNLFKVTQENIDDFVAKGIIPLKAEWIAKQGKKKAKEAVDKPDEEIEIPKRQTAKIPNVFTQTANLEEIIESVEEEIPGEAEAVENKTPIVRPREARAVAAIPPTLKSEVWRSKPLTERDLNVPSGNNTNITGAMNLKKGLLDGIDHRHHFRDVIFNDLDWQPKDNKPHLEVASADFKINIDGIDKGEHRLTLNHNTKTNTKTYKQNNAMTEIKWGGVKDIIAKREYLGKTMTINKDESNPNKFIINIH